MPRRHTPRLATFDYSGLHRYSLTFCTYQRRRTFESPTIASTVLEQFSRACEREQFAILCYCFMPDHVHLLAAGDTLTSDARKFVNRAKQLSGHWYRQSYLEPLWQRSAWDRVLRSEDDTWTVIRYILANPVRAGLVAQPLDYELSGSLIYGRAELIDAFDMRSGQS